MARRVTRKRTTQRRRKTIKGGLWWGGQTEEEKADGPPELLFVHGGHTDRPSDLSWNLNERLMLASTADDNVLQVW